MINLTTTQQNLMIGRIKQMILINGLLQLRQKSNRSMFRLLTRLIKKDRRNIWRYKQSSLFHKHCCDTEFSATEEGFCQFSWFNIARILPNKSKKAMIVSMMLYLVEDNLSMKVLYLLRNERNSSLIWKIFLEIGIVLWTWLMNLKISKLFIR